MHYTPQRSKESVAIAALAMFLVLASTAAACGGGGGPQVSDEGNERPIYCELLVDNVTAVTVNRGDYVMLNWKTHRATSAQLNGEQVQYLPSADEHLRYYPYRNIRVMETTTFTINVSGPSGSATCTATVQVVDPVPVTPAPACTISASPNSVQQGSSTTLTFSSTNASSASISTIGAVALADTRSVTPASTTTYVMTVTGAGGSATCQTTVVVTAPPIVVVPAPTCLLNASQESIQQGQSTSLYWNSTNATSATLTTVGTVGITGTQSISPQSTTSYVLTVTGSGGTATCSKTVGVTAPPVVYVPPTYDAPYCSLSASQTSVSHGGATTLTWTSTDSTTAFLDVSGYVSTSGSYTAGNIYGTRTFVLTVHGNGGSRTCQVTVTAQPQTFTPPPPVYYPPPQVYQPPVYVPPSTYVPPAPVQYTHYAYNPAPAASPVRYVAPARVSLANVPYTGAEDYIMPLFALTLALSAAYLLRTAVRV